MKHILRILSYGFLLFLITIVSLFLLSLVAGSDQPTGNWWIGVLIALIMSVISLGFSRRLHPASAGKAFTYGFVWAIEIAAILFIIAIPNGTTATVFGQWSMYLVFLGVAVGPLIRRVKTSGPVSTM